jgi:glycosyltransferase involved in cell wall biosynthesis
MRVPDCSILIPLYNEEQNLLPGIRELFAFLENRGIESEILLGSNGSTDATALIGKMLADAAPERIRFFHIDERGFVGRVFREAASIACSPYLVSVDMDLSTDLEFIPEALELLRRYDIVVGSKKSGFQERSFTRLLGSMLFIACTQTMLSLPYDDYSISAKAYRLETVRGLLEGISDDSNYVIDVLHKARRKGLDIKSLPVACADWRTSRFSLLREALARFSHLFHLWLGQFGRKVGSGNRT